MRSHYFGEVRRLNCHSKNEVKERLQVFDCDYLTQTINVRKYVHIHAMEILLDNAGISFLKDCQENAGCFLDEVSFHYQ